MMDGSAMGTTGTNCSPTGFAYMAESMLRSEGLAAQCDTREGIWSSYDVFDH